MSGTTFPALTVWQPWATLIAMGAKPFEFRPWCAPKAYWGKRLAIHAGARKVKREEIQDLLLRVGRDGADGTALDVGQARPLLERLISAPGLVPLSSVVCIVTLGQPRKATALFGGQGDSDRIDKHVWAWPVTHITALEPPQPATGAQGFWTWTAPPGCEAR